MTSIDRRRNNGPAVSTPPVFRVESDVPGEVVMTDGAGDEGGDDDDERFFLQTGLVANANGSAFYESAACKLVVSLHGPRPAQRSAARDGEAAAAGVRSLAAVSTQLTLAPFCGLAGEVGAGEARLLAGLLDASTRAAVRTSLYPKAEIALHVAVLDGRPGPGAVARVLAACVTACSAALADAGIDLLDLPTGGLARAADDGRAVVVGYMPRRREMTLVYGTVGGEGATDVVDGADARVDALVRRAIDRAVVTNLAVCKVLLEQ